MTVWAAVEVSQTAKRALGPRWGIEADEPRTELFGAETGERKDE